jgi:hypothetical protein
VSINYRLNIFSFGDGKERSLALKDQRLGISGLDRVCDNFGRVTNLGGSGAECDDLRATMYPEITA